MIFLAELAFKSDRLLVKYNLFDFWEYEQLAFLNLR